ncbi:hypothetical protein [Nocardia jiangsuensis]|uniref:Integrase-like protein n=1 Tax=Nocardia jiangsuensis TaxID=1691563 RepID=A0ABV8DUD8_9NOCA
MINALAETTIGLYKTEAVRDDSPFRRRPLTRLTDVKLLTADWVGWFNRSRITGSAAARLPSAKPTTIHATPSYRLETDNPVRIEHGAVQRDRGSTVVPATGSLRTLGRPRPRRPDPAPALAGLAVYAIAVFSLALYPLEKIKR